MVLGMERVSGILRKCKSLSKLKMSSSYATQRTKSVGGDRWAADVGAGGEECRPREDGAVVFVGSSRRPYVIDAKYLGHPLLSALLERSAGGGDVGEVTVKCEVVLFDHLLWMLENADLGGAAGAESLEELASLYAC